MKIRLTIYGSILLVVLIVSLVVKIVNKTSVKGVSITPINKENLVFSEADALKYFYEPKPFSNGGPVPSYIPFKAKYTINADSLNERYDYSQNKPPGVFRIMTLGDSFTYGLYVDTADNWTERLEILLEHDFNCPNYSKIEVINLGVYGYDNDYSVERFKKRGKKYDPDLVLWLQAVPTRINELLTPLIKKYYSDSSRSGELEEQIKAGKYYESGSKARTELIRKLGMENIYKYQKEAIARISNYYSGPLVLMAIPSISEREKKFIQQITVTQPNWKYFDSLERLDKEGGYFKGDGHPNQKGHRIIAEEILKYLKQNELIQCH